MPKHLTMKQRLLSVVDDPETTRASKEDLLKVAAKMHNDAEQRRHRRAMERLKRRRFDQIVPNSLVSPRPPLGQVAQDALDKFFEDSKNKTTN